MAVDPADPYLAQLTVGRRIVAEEKVLAVRISAVVVLELGRFEQRRVCRETQQFFVTTTTNITATATIHSCSRSLAIGLEEIAVVEDEPVLGPADAPGHADVRVGADALLLLLLLLLHLGTGSGTHGVEAGAGDEWQWSDGLGEPGR